MDMQAIADKLQQIADIKADIKAALEARGQTPDESFNTYKNYIDNIETQFLGQTPVNGILQSDVSKYDLVYMDAVDNIIYPLVPNYASTLASALTATSYFGYAMSSGLATEYIDIMALVVPDQE